MMDLNYSDYSAVRPGTSELLVPAAQCNNEKSGFGLNVVKADPTFGVAERRTIFMVEHVDFSVDILNDLIEQGYTGTELVTKFAEIKRNIPDALKRLEKEARSGETMFGTDLETFIDSLNDE